MPMDRMKRKVHAVDVMRDLVDVEEVDGVVFPGSLVECCEGFPVLFAVILVGEIRFERLEEPLEVGGTLGTWFTACDMGRIKLDLLGDASSCLEFFPVDYLCQPKCQIR